MKKKILFILIDSFSKKDFLFIQKNIDIFPAFKLLIDKSYLFKNIFSVSNPTEFTLPSIFSSSLPLDAKTYEYGISNRNTQFLDELSKDYEINLFSNVAVFGKLYGYDKNYMNIKNYASIQIIWTHFVRNYLWHLKNNNIFSSKELRLSKFEEIISRFFPYFIDYLETDISLYTKFILGKKIDKKKLLIIKRIKKEYELFSLSPSDYFIQNYEKMIDRTFFSFFGLNSIKEKIIINTSKFFKKTSQNWKDGRFYIFRYEFSFNNIFSHCSYIFSDVLNDLYNDDSHSFNYIHLMDLHNNKIGSNNFINKKFKNKKLDTNSKQSLKFIDNELGKFLKKIRDINDFSICITSDHGTIDKNDKGPLTTNEEEGIFHDDFLKIPMILTKSFFNSKIDTNKIYSSIHIIPLILKSINKNFSCNFLNDNHIICEHCHRGPSSNNLNNNIFYLCLMTLDYKIILKQKKSQFDISPFYNKKSFSKKFSKKINISDSHMKLLNDRFEYLNKKIINY